MTADLKTYIEKQELCSSADRLLLAVSGGLDSVVLVHLLWHAGFTNIAIAHANFMLRGAESDGDEQFVRDLASHYGVPCHVERLSTDAHINSFGGSVQMAARELRYQWFLQLRTDHNYQVVVTAHHLTDSIETALYNFTKGTGAAGLRGISPKHGQVIRPLLFATRDMILQYAQQHGLRWRDDSSNESDKYARNKLRHHVMPILREINPGLEQTFVNTSVRMRSIEKLIEQQTDKLIAAAETTDDHLVVPLGVLRDAKMVVVENWLKRYGFNFDQASALIDQIANPQAGKQFFSHDYILTVDRDSVYITKHEEVVINELVSEYGMIKLPTIAVEYALTDNLSISSSADEAKLDASKLNFPLTLRTWQEGDAFVPLGMKGKKKVSDFMIDVKIPLNLKRRVCVLTSGKDIVWLVGHRISDQYKLTKTTQKAFFIKLVHD